MSLELGGNGWGRGFLAHLHPPWGYDEPELLRYSNRQFGPIGADAGRGERRLATDAAHPAASDEVKALRLQGMVISAGLDPSLLCYGIREGRVMLDRRDRNEKRYAAFRPPAAAEEA